MPCPPPRDLLTQGSNLHLLHWQADSQPLRHQGSPIKDGQLSQQHSLYNSTTQTASIKSLLSSYLRLMHGSTKKEETTPTEQMRSMRRDPERHSCKNHFPHQALLRASDQRVLTRSRCLPFLLCSYFLHPGWVQSPCAAAS